MKHDKEPDPDRARKALRMPAKPRNAAAQKDRYRTSSRPDSGEALTIAEVIAELKVSRSTFYYWRQTGKAPRCIKLPNGEIRVRRMDFDLWLSSLEDAA